MPTVLNIDHNAESSLAEGNAGTTTTLQFYVERTGDVAGASSVGWKVSAADFSSATPADFVGGGYPSGQVTFAPGETRKTISIQVAGDKAPEASEAFRMTLSDPVGATLGRTEALGSIENDDGRAPIFTIQGPSQAQYEPDSGSIPYVFQVIRSGGGNEAASLTYAVSGDGMVQADAQDFVGGVLPTGRVDFAAGEMSRTIVIHVAGDRTIEEGEGFAVTISPIETATVSPEIERHRETASGYILSDDYRPTMHLRTANSDHWEGNSGTTTRIFIVERTGKLDPMTVDWTVSGGSGVTAPASASDFLGGQFPSGRISFAAGQREQQIVIQVVGDQAYERSEEFVLTLSNPSDNTSFVRSQLTETIMNDDFPPTLSIAAEKAEVDEGQSGFVAVRFVVSRTGDVAIASSVNWEVAWPYTTLSLSDFQAGAATSGRLDFAAGQTTKTVTLNVVSDTIVELDETVTLMLSQPTEPSVISIGKSHAQATIIDDDFPVGGPVSDSLTDAPGADAVFGGPGNDTISGANGGYNYLRGDEGNDSIVGGRDFDDINGNMGDDTAAGGLGDDWVVGGKDNDLLYGDQGHDVVFGNLGNDTCYGGDGADLMRGGQHDDVLRGEAGNDWLSGDRGADTITGGAGADIFHGFGDGGLDRITDFNRAEGDRIELDWGSTYSVAQVGANAVISIAGGSQMVLLGVQTSSLIGDWISIV